MITREHFVAAGLYKLLLPYLYGAKGDIMLDRGVWVPVPKNPDTNKARAYDCSGLPMDILRELGGPDLRRTHYTDVLWDPAKGGLSPTTSPEPGDLAFYGGSSELDVSHVMIVIGMVGGKFMVFGASGGRSSTLDYKEAAARRAFVKIKESHLYRADFRGFRSMSKFLGKENT